MRWYAKKLGGPANQALIIDEETGRNVAVAYDAKDARMLAAAPELAEVARQILLEAERGRRNIPADLVRGARAALQEAGVEI